MTQRTLPALLVLLAGATAAREVRVCVLNDSAFPVYGGLISEALSAASQEYREQVAISFRFEEIASFSGDLSAWALDLGPQLRRACPEETELRLVFSNRQMFRREVSSPADAKEGDTEDEFAATSHDYFGFAVFFHFEHRAAQKDLSGNPAHVNTLKHELGHLFGAEHSDDRNSFMFARSNKSDGRWTEDVVRVLRANRERRWFPRR